MRALWRVFFFFRRQITLVLIFEKMCKLLRLSARSHSRDFFTLSCTPFHMLIPTISSASIRRPVQGSGRLLSGAEPISRQHQRPCLSSRSGKPAPPTPRLPAPLPCFRGVCTQHHYSSLTSARPVRGGVITC